jgi:hypothetical protein
VAERHRLTRALTDFTDAARRAGASDRLNVDESHLLEWLV